VSPWLRCFLSAVAALRVLMRGQAREPVKRTQQQWDSHSERVLMRGQAREPVASVLPVGSEVRGESNLSRAHSVTQGERNVWAQTVWTE